MGHLEIGLLPNLGAFHITRQFMQNNFSFQAGQSQIILSIQSKKEHD